MNYLLPLKIDFRKSNGSYLFDKNTQTKYLDFFSMYSSLPLGYNHTIFDDSFKSKINEISYIKMTNNVCQSDEFLDMINIFKQYTFSKNFHFTCTGALAVESALKAAMEYKKIDNPLILSVKNSFHGVNSWGFTTSRVGVTAKRMEYFPKNNWLDLSLDDIIKYLERKNLKNLTAIIIEPIQATNGDIYLDKNKLKIIRNLCIEKDICFILDEIQTGFGTTGKMWYYEYLDLIPDILVFGKKSQVSGIVISNKYKGILESTYQKLDVTFDGDLIDIVRSTYILKAFEKYNILNNVKNNSNKLKQNLESHVLNYRSIGHLIAFDFKNSKLRDNFVKKCFDNKLLINKGGETSVRLRPNLALNQKEINEFIQKVKELI
ncbi:aminotransferase class III-fold pyridoxal phosphate-dependent enzyme [Halarcobacter sp.]|uniref:aminotransferase class III-fold pyridoxal phosphate-dependent enzyme n=1 Tax=Halarcobacter sp. TaxID=2321133 RepID=UPI002AA8F40E|nr:aminotransferase class III-fold pyridoxal phosphate-dependent enzyme [Halarcobacter sp.]